MNAAVAPPLYTVQDGDASRDRDTVLSIWRGNLGQETHLAAKYDWFYLGTPGEPPLLQLLRHEPSGAAVGVCSAGRRRMLWRGREIRAGVLVDLAVMPEHRSLGPALILQQGLIAAGQRELDLLYGFPNLKAAPVFKRIGYSHLADIVRYARVLRHAGYLARHMPPVLARPLGAVVDIAMHLRDALHGLGGPRLLCKWSDHADSRMDTLWSASAHGGGPVAIRDAQHVRWRFDEAPLGEARHLLLSEADGELSAWFATQIVDGTLHVRDFWSSDAAQGIGTRYIDALLGAARSEGHSAVSVEMAVPESHLAAWHSRAFVARGHRPVFGRWSSPATSNDANVELHLTSADEDE